jgi:hypothetical protein
MELRLALKAKALLGAPAILAIMREMPLGMASPLRVER